MQIDENVGRHEVGKVVLFQPDPGNAAMSQRAVVVRNYGLEGKVLYDIAVFTQDTQEFYYARPLKEVDSYFVNNLDGN